MFKSCCPLWLMLFQVLRKIVPPPPNLAKTRWNILGTFTFKQQVNVGFFLCYFLKEKNHFVSKSKKECLKVAKPKRGGEKCLETLQPHLCLVNKASLFHAVCCGRMCFLCASACVSEPHSVCDLLLLQHSPPFSVCWSTAMLKEATIRSAINLDTSYLCLPLQGEVCAVTNMINPLPLCWQPPAPLPNLHPPLP